MTTVAIAPPPRKPTRKPRPKPERFTKITRLGDVAVLLIREKHAKKPDTIDTYTAEQFPSECGGRGLELTKPDGTVYHVCLSGKASTCDCPGMEHHGWHKGPDGEPTACKHIMALLKLEANGKL
jgi:hypothetical protein